MLAAATAELLGRIATARSLAEFVRERETAAGGALGDVVTRATKGLVFVHNYAAYEYVVTQCVYALNTELNRRAIPLNRLRTELLSVALHPECGSLIDGSLKKTWALRCELFSRARSAAGAAVHEQLLPKDGSHFRPAQLELVWSLFGMPPPFVEKLRHLGLIEEMVENRNKIAHGLESPENVGRRYSANDIVERVRDTETICSYLVAKAQAHIGSPTAFLA
jgi:hypothetical protein